MAAKITVINDFQEKLEARQNELLNDEKFQLAKQLIGPVALFKTYTPSELENRKLPWLDGEFSTGISISNEGNEFSVNLEECDMEDVLTLVYYYYEQKAARENTLEMKVLIQHLLEAQLMLIARKVRQELRDVLKSES